jgi:hypothetical protein
LTIALSACRANTAPAHAPTETTSASIPTTVSKTALARAENERDEALNQLQQAIAWNAEERSRLLAEIRARSDRDDLIYAAWVSIDFTEIEILSARDRAANMPWKHRRRLEKAITKAKALEAFVEFGARNLPSVHDSTWPESRRLLESAIDELHSAVHKVTDDTSIR